MTTGNVRPLANAIRCKPGTVLSNSHAGAGSSKPAPPNPGQGCSRWAKLGVGVPAHRGPLLRAKACLNSRAAPMPSRGGRCVVQRSLPNAAP